MDRPFTFEEFKAIYSKVPRLCVEVVVCGENGVLLTYRDIDPWKNTWHLPGGTVYFEEPAVDACKRIAKEELGADVSIDKFAGYLEYPSTKDQPGAFDWSVSLMFLASLTSNKINLSSEAKDYKFYKKLPENTLPEHKEWLIKNNLAT